MRQKEETAKKEINYVYLIGGLVIVGGIIGAVAGMRKNTTEELTPIPMPPAPPAPSAPAGFYPSAGERDKRIAEATAAAQSGDQVKLAAALAKLSPEDRAKLQSMLPHFPGSAQPSSFYPSEAERNMRIADATAAAQSGDPAKLATALAKLSPEDRTKLEQFLPHL